MQPFKYCLDLEERLKSPSWPLSPDLLGVTKNLTGRLESDNSLIWQALHCETLLARAMSMEE